MEPSGPLTLNLKGIVDSSVVTEAGRECTYSLTARVAGGESDTAYIEWDHGELEWQTNPGGEVVRTESLSAEDLADLWGSERILTGNEVTVDRTARMADSSAFQVDHRLRYRLSTTGAVRGTVWRLVCE